MSVSDGRCHGRLAGTVSLVVMLALGGCRRQGATLDARWVSKDTISLSMPAAASWCVAGRYLEIRATRGDTGIAVALFPADSTEAIVGDYPLLGRATASDSSRPFAIVALRWTDLIAVYGARSDSGTVALRREADGHLGGEFGGRAVFQGTTDRQLTVTGTFGSMTMDTASEACPILAPLVPPLPPDTSADALAGADSLMGVDSLDGIDLLPKGIRPQDLRGRDALRRLLQRRGRGLAGQRLPSQHRPPDDSTRP